MATTESLDQQFFEALQAAYLDFAQRQLSEDEASARFAALEDRFAPQYESLGETEKAQETRRRVAEGLLAVGIEYGRSPAECEALLGRVIALGFADLNAKASTLTMFCGHFSFENTDEAMIRRYLDPLIVELKIESERTSAEAWRNYLDTCYRIHKRLRTTL